MTKKNCWNVILFSIYSYRCFKSLKIFRNLKRKQNPRQQCPLLSGETATSIPRPRPPAVPRRPRAAALIYKLIRRLWRRPQKCPNRWTCRWSFIRSGGRRIQRIHPPKMPKIRRRRLRNRRWTTADTTRIPALRYSYLNLFEFIPKTYALNLYSWRKKMIPPKCSECSVPISVSYLRSDAFIVVVSLNFFFISSTFGPPKVKYLHKNLLHVFAVKPKNFLQCDENRFSVSLMWTNSTWIQCEFNANKKNLDECSVSDDSLFNVSDQLWLRWYYANLLKTH